MPEEEEVKVLVVDLVETTTVWLIKFPRKRNKVKIMQSIFNNFDIL